MDQFIVWILFGIPAFILSGSVHEYMHAWTAKKLGDYTATMEGRLTLNPLAHIDPYGFILMVIARFGWMRPIPINQYNFNNPVRDMAITAAAGPASNLVMALITALVYRLLFEMGLLASLGIPEIAYTFIENFIFTFLWVNVALMLFNLIPLPPLDGSRIIRVFLPSNLRYYWEEIEKYAPFILLAIFILPPLSTVTGTLLSGGTIYIVSLLIG